LLEAPAYRDAQHWSALGDLMATKSLCLDSYVVSSTRQMTKARPEERASLRQARTASVLRIDEARAKAAQAYGQAAAFRDYERADRVLYEQGVVLLAARRDAEAQKAFDRLRAEHPGSPAIADADLAMADRAFDDGDFAGARTLYERTESGPPSTAGATARYRRAWCELALGRTGEALRVLTSVIAASELRTPEVDPRQQRALASAARRDLVRVYAQAGDARAVEAGPLFRRIGGDHAQSMLRDLADSYRKQGRTADAEQVLSGADLAPPGAHP
jgi:tetratricopeptide (TPR) repeat protein